MEISRIVEEPGQALIVFGTNGAQIPVPSQVSGYKTLRAQLDSWSSIEVLPKRRLPGSLLYFAWVTVFVSTNPVLVPLGAAILATVALYYTLHPYARVQHPIPSSAALWRNFVVASSVLILKVFLSRL